MDYLTRAVNEYCKSDKNLELEIRFTLSVHDFRKLYSALGTGQSSIEQSLNAIITISEHINNRYEVYFDSGTRKHTSYIQKHQLAKAFLKNPIQCRVSVAEEIKIPEFSAARASFIRLKYRKSVILPGNNWRADFTLIKNVQKSQFNELEHIKNEFFKMPESKFLSYDQCEFELEYVGTVNHMRIEKNSEIMSAITKIAKIINPDTTDDPELTSMLAEITQILKISNGETLKQIANQPKNLNFTIYQTLIPHISDYYCSDKADGERGFLYCTDKCRILLTSTLITLPDKSPGNFLLDVEVMRTGDIKMYAFDMLICDTKNVSDLPFAGRLDMMSKIISKIPKCELKEQVRLGPDYATQLSNILNRSSRLYPIDGLIFTPANDTYARMTVYKWKPPERQTIDFLVVQPPESVVGSEPYTIKEDSTLMFLFSGISLHHYRQLGIKECPGYRSMIKNSRTTVFPTAFQPSMNPYAYIYYHPKSHPVSAADLNYHVAEFLGSSDQQWTLHTLRPDRDSQVARGIGCGNYFTTAEDVYSGYYDPFTVDKLLKPEKYGKTIYFGEQKLEIYKPLTKFNAFVKAQLIRQLEDSEFIIDMAAGKGQDLFTIHGFGIKNALFMDVSAEAIAELNKRKYDLGKRHQYVFGFRSTPIKIYTKVLDLTMPHAQTIEALKDVPIVQVDGIIMNFAIHYIIKDQPSADNLIALLNNYMKANGLFIFTCFDGERIFELLKDVKTGESYDMMEDGKLKYSMKKLYTETVFKPYGLKISAIHPFSRGEYYTENLIGLKWLISVFKQHNYTVIQLGSFGDWLDKFSRFNQRIYEKMSTHDKQYASLYSYMTLSYGN